MKKFIYCLIFICFYSHSSDPSLEEEKLKQNLQRAQQAVWDVNILNEVNEIEHHEKTNTGVGFFVDRDLFVTNLSSIRSASSMRNILLTQGHHQIEIINLLSLSTEADLVLLKTKVDSDYFFEIKQPSQNSDFFYSINTPSFGELSFFSHSKEGVRSLIPSVYQTVSNVFDISSQVGKPLVNAYGELMGILFYADKHINRFLSIAHLESIIKNQSPQGLVVFGNSFRRVLEEEKNRAKEVFAKEARKYTQLKDVPHILFSNIMLYLPLSTLEDLFSDSDTDKDKLSEWVFLLADMGNVYAQTLFGQMLDRNTREAFSWLDKASVSPRNSLLPTLLISQMLLDGKSISSFIEGTMMGIKFRSLIYWLRRVARMNHLESQIKLNHLYKQGRILEEPEKPKVPEATINSEAEFERTYNQIIQRIESEFQELLSIYGVSEEEIEEILQESYNTQSDSQYLKQIREKMVTALGEVRQCSQSLRLEN